jgi:sec-independent protein translocase protein TatC
VRRILRRPRRRDPEGRMTILEHLGELRYRLVWIISSVSLAGIAGWVMFDRVVEILKRPACPYLERAPTGCDLIFTGPLDIFTLRLKVSIYIGFAIAFPIVLFHFWRFVSPGLHRREKRYVIPFVFSGMVLFVTGVYFAYMTLPQALQFLIGPAITGTSALPLLAVKDFINFMLLYLLAFGLCFEFPLVLMFLSLARVITSRQMARFRRHVFVGIAVVVAVATPSVDLYTMTVLTAAMYILYEACIWLSRLLKR